MQKLQQRGAVVVVANAGRVLPMSKGCTATCVLLFSRILQRGGGSVNLKLPCTGGSACRPYALGSVTTQRLWVEGIHVAVHPSWTYPEPHPLMMISRISAYLVRRVYTQRVAWFSMAYCGVLQIPWVPLRSRERGGPQCKVVTPWLA